MALNLFPHIFSICRAFCHANDADDADYAVHPIAIAYVSVPTRHIKTFKLKACQIIRYIDISQRRMCFDKKKTVKAQNDAFGWV